MAVEALRGGAYYFLEKPYSGNQLVDRVLESLAHVDAASAAPDRGAAALDVLTPRERDIASHIVAHPPKREIAHAQNYCKTLAQGKTLSLTINPGHGAQIK